MSWHLLEKALDEISKQSTIFGKLWITFFFILRVIPLTRMGESVYGDEQAAFKCNVKQTGCENVCFNQFSPISPIRFWGFQMVIVVTTPIIFLVYATYTIFLTSTAKTAKKKLALVKEQQLKSFESSQMTSKKPTHSTANDFTIGIGNCNQKTIKSSCWSEPIQKTHTWQEVCTIGATPNTEMDTFQESSGLSYGLKTKLDKVQRDQDKLFDVIRLSDLQPQSRILHESKSESRSNDPRYWKQNGMYEVISLSCFRFLSDDEAIERKSSFAGRRFHRGERLTAPELHAQCPSASAITSCPESIISLHSTTARCSVSEFSDQVDGVWEEDDHVTEKEKLTLLRLNEKKIGDKIHYKVTSSQINSVKRRTSNASPTESYTGNCRLRKMMEKNEHETPETASQENTKAQESKLHQIQMLNKEISRYNKLAQSLRGIGIAYFGQCFMRLLVDVGFAYLQYVLFLFDVPEIYKCKRWPCPNTVDCFISRAEEKTFMLHFMFNSSVISIFLTLCEIFVLCYRYSKQWYDRKQRASAKAKKGELIKCAQSQTSSVNQLRTKRGLAAIKHVQNQGGLNGDGSDSGSNNSVATFNSGDLSAMMENDLAADELDLNEDQDDGQDDDFD